MLRVHDRLVRVAALAALAAVAACTARSTPAPAPVAVTEDAAPRCGPRPPDLLIESTGRDGEADIGWSLRLGSEGGSWQSGQRKGSDFPLAPADLDAVWAIVCAAPGAIDRPDGGAGTMLRVHHAGRDHWFPGEGAVADALRDFAKHKVAP
jgi:hypothetical protein